MFHLKLFNADRKGVDSADTVTPPNTGRNRQEEKSQA